MTQEWKGETVQMPEAFGIKSGKKPELCTIKSKLDVTNMIETVADLLEQIRDKGLRKIIEKESDIKHRPTIGNIYEGLTKDMLSKAVFRGLGLQVVLNSFIYNDSGDISDEMDCMVVVGQGDQISFTNQFKFHISNVIAVIQVKKKLFASDIDDAYYNLRSVKKIAEPRDAEDFVGRLFKDAYQGLFQKPFPSDRCKARFTERENLIYHYLMMEAFVPLRIVFSFFGYTDEYALREGFIKLLERRVKDGPAKGYSPGSFPNIIICGDACVVKNNGMPNTFPFIDFDFYWPILATANERAIYYLLDLIWNRLSYKFGIPSSHLFDDDLKLSSIHFFLSAKEKKMGDSSWAWEYYYHEFSRKTLQESQLTSIDWEPAEIEDHESEFLVILQIARRLDLYGGSLQKFLKRFNLDRDHFLKRLTSKQLIFIDEGYVQLLPENLMIVNWREKTFAGDNIKGKMSKWLQEKHK